MVKDDNNVTVSNQSLRYVKGNDNIGIGHEGDITGSQNTFVATRQVMVETPPLRIVQVILMSYGLSNLRVSQLVNKM